jgi:hypothetical protein
MFDIPIADDHPLFSDALQRAVLAAHALLAGVATESHQS